MQLNVDFFRKVLSIKIFPPINKNITISIAFITNIW